MDIFLRGLTEGISGLGGLLIFDCLMGMVVVSPNDPAALDSPLRVGLSDPSSSFSLSDLGACIDFRRTGDAFARGVEGLDSSQFA